MRLSNKYGGLQFFAPPVCIVKFDSNIIKVSCNDVTWTTSGDSTGVYFDEGSNIFTVTLASGYVIDTVTVNPDTVISIGFNTFTLNISYIDAGHVITITSKLGGATTMSKSYDLSTSSKWANLAAGSHTVKIRAKGSGYADSPFSNEVSVTKAASTKTLEAGTYKWVDSPNIGQQFVEETFVLIQFSSYGLEYDSLKIWLDGDIGLLYYIKNGEANSAYFTDSGWVFDDYKTITFSTDQTVSADFYNWAITGGNLVKQESETWVLNEYQYVETTVSYSASFSSNGAEFSYILLNDMLGSISYTYADGSGTVIAWKGSWRNDTYRTITFSTPPTGDLLTWLQANGTKQGGGN